MKETMKMGYLKIICNYEYAKIFFFNEKFNVYVKDVDRRYILISSNINQCQNAFSNEEEVMYVFTYMKTQLNTNNESLSGQKK